MNGAFHADLARMRDGGGRSPWARFAFWFMNSEMHCVACYRFGQFAARLRRRTAFALPLIVLHRVWHRWCTHLHHCEISRDATIGPGFVIMHRTGVNIGPVVAGADFTVYQNVTVGMRIAKGDRGVPVFGDSVWLGPGATISGPITVGDRVTISAGTVLSRDVPDACLVAGNPGRVIARDYDNTAIVNTTDPEASRPGR